MRADLSRGHRPDEKRAQRYRRILTQQGRLWLDSDVAASVDATDRLIRHVARDVGCPAGSPDAGYLASPGRAFAWFDSIDHVGNISAAPFRAFRDYAKKYMERFASLYLDARGGTGEVTIRGRSTSVASNGVLRVWMSVAPGGTVPTMKVGGAAMGAPVQVPGNFGFEAYDYNVAGADPSQQNIVLELGAGASNEVWVGFIEAHNPAPPSPLFWTTAGSYYLDGLEVERTAEEAASPHPAPLDETRFVVYVEGWERLITHVEEAGLRDTALGGLDSTVRTRPMGQVKAAAVPANALTLDEIIASIGKAFTHINFGAGKLTVGPAISPPNPDPCAIPVEGGYNADENRLYRFEIHVPGDLGATRIKWSRNNGSELYATTVKDAAAGTLEVSSTPGTAPPMQLLENDIVELIDEGIDLFDAARATLDLASTEPSISPAERRVGVLCYVRATDDDNIYEICKLGSSSPINFNLNNPPAPTRLRKWDGIIVSTSPGPSKHTIEDGLDLTLEGSDFRVGDYWQFEARRSGNNAMSPWQVERHGPERLLAPLALFRIGAAATDPVELEHWFDDRFRPVCELRADDIYYDGEKSGTEADTVQEAIDELYILVDKGGGCCDFTLTPSENPAADDTARLQDLIDQIESRGKICLERGIYNLFGTIKIDKKHVTIEGCPEAIILAAADSGPVFELHEAAGIALEALFLRATGKHAIIRCTTATGAWEDPVNRLSVKLREAWLFHTGTAPVIHDIWAEDPIFPLGTNDPWPEAVEDPPTNNSFDIRMEASVIAGRCGILTPRSSLVEILDSVVSATRVGMLCAFHVGTRVVIRDSRVACDWNDERRDSIASAEPETLAAQAPRAFDIGQTYEDDSVALASGRPGTEWPPLVEITRSNLTAAAAVIGWNTLVAEGSTIEATIWNAVFGSELVVTATDSTFVSHKVAAIHGLSGQVDLTHCEISAPFGVVLCLHADMKTIWKWGGMLRTRISGCRFLSYDRSDAPMLGGVLIGGQPGSFDELPDMLDTDPSGIDITDNIFDPSSNKPSHFAISVAIQREPERFWSPSISIHKNCIRGSFRMGICVRGSRYSITSNDLAINTEGVQTLGKEHGSIVAYEGARSIIADNVVVVFVHEVVADARGITVVGPGDNPRHDIVIRGNRIAPDANSTGPLRPLVVDGPTTTPLFHQLVVENNDLMGSKVEIGRTSSVLVRGNRFQVNTVGIPSCEHGAFQENRALESGSVEITGAAGTWTVDHNEVGELYLRPSTHWIFVVAGGGLATFPIIMHRYIAGNAPTPVEVLAREITTFFGALTVTPPPMGTVMVPGAKENVGDAMFARGVSLALAAIFDDLITTLALTPGRNENKYRAHVSDNIVRKSLIVGHPPPLPPADGGGAGTHAGSWVQVLGNQVGEWLSVNKYQRLLVLNNMANDLHPPPLGGVTSPTAANNFDA